MSSNVTLNFETPIKLELWLAFCAANDIVFSPNTCGQNVFYCGQIAFTLGGKGHLPKLDNGNHDYEHATPPDLFSYLSISSYIGCNLSDIGKHFAKACEHFILFSYQVSCCPELNYHLMKEHKKSRKETIILTTIQQEESFAVACQVLCDAVTQRFFFEYFELRYRIHQNNNQYHLSSVGHDREHLQSFRTMAQLQQYIQDEDKADAVSHVSLNDIEWLTDTSALDLLNNEHDGFIANNAQRDAIRHIVKSEDEPNVSSLLDCLNYNK
jgi:hypothetical protein